MHSNSHSFVSNKEAGFETIDSAQRAKRLSARKSRVVERSKPYHTADPIPVFRLGQQKRFCWETPEINGWQSHRVTTTVKRPAMRKPETHWFRKENSSGPAR